MESGPLSLHQEGGNSQLSAGRRRARSPGRPRATRGQLRASWQPPPLPTGPPPIHLPHPIHKPGLAFSPLHPCTLHTAQPSFLSSEIIGAERTQEAGAELLPLNFKSTQSWGATPKGTVLEATEQGPWGHREAPDPGPEPIGGTDGGTGPGQGPQLLGLTPGRSLHSPAPPGTGSH